MQEGVTGRLFEPGAAIDLRAQVLPLIRNPEMRLAMGRAGREAAMRRSWPTVMAELMDHYQTLLHRSPSSTWRIASRH